MTRIFSIPYQFNVSPNSSANQTSNLLTGLSQLIGAYLIFPPGTGSNLQYQFIEAGGKPTTTTTQAGGPDVNQEAINPGYYVGDGIAYPVPWQKTPYTDPEAIIMNAINSTGVNLTAAAIIWLSR